ncbi:hypothetical protein DM02DRAFT_614629, partial [Periconia macrospinosa]
MSARTSPQDPSTLYEDAQSSVKQHLTSLKSHLYTQFSLWDAYLAAEKAKAASLKEEVVMLRKEASCPAKGSRRALTICRSRSGRRCSSGAAAAAERGRIGTCRWKKHRRKLTLTVLRRPLCILHNPSQKRQSLGRKRWTIALGSLRDGGRA